MKSIYLFLLLTIPQFIFSHEYRRCQIGSGSIMGITLHEDNRIGVTLDSLFSQDLPLSVSKVFSDAQLMFSYEQIRSASFTLDRCKDSLSTNNFDCSTSESPYLSLLVRHRDAEGYFHERYINTTAYIELSLRPNQNDYIGVIEIQKNGKYARGEFTIYSCNGK